MGPPCRLGDSKVVNGRLHPRSIRDDRVITLPSHPLAQGTKVPPRRVTDQVSASQPADCPIDSHENLHTIDAEARAAKAKHDAFLAARGLPELP